MPAMQQVLLQGACEARTSLPGQPGLKAFWQVRHLIQHLKDESREVCTQGKVKRYTTQQASNAYKGTRVWYIWESEHFHVPRAGHLSRHSELLQI